LDTGSIALAKADQMLVATAESYITSTEHTISVQCGSPR